MSDYKRIETALISVFNKDKLNELAQALHGAGVKLISTGGTFDYLQALSIPVGTIEELTSYPSILGGRVKTLHPKVFGGILNRRESQSDSAEIELYDIPNIDLVIVDLYPFEETVASGGTEQEIIEKIDIGGVSLIRAAAKNYNDVAIISEIAQYDSFISDFQHNNSGLNLAQRKQMASRAFQVIAHYDAAISAYFSEQLNPLRYGENPHQKAFFDGDLAKCFDQLNGKALSYNNLLDVDAAVKLINEFNETACAIIKHNNACGFAIDPNQSLAYEKALAGDPVSAFGGIVVFSSKLILDTAQKLNELFCEVVIAPDYEPEALELLKSKSNRILLKLKPFKLPLNESRTILNGQLWQNSDSGTNDLAEAKLVTSKQPSENELRDLNIACKLSKHTKSNSIALVKNGQLVASGGGQTSRVDALKHAINKARHFKLDLNGAAMASEAFFPFPDCVEIGAQAGVSAIIQPGGSIKDQLSIDKANELNISMLLTGIRHFKH